MKTVTFTAEEIRMIGIQFDANACSAGCPLEHMPRLPKRHGVALCYAENDKGEFICPFQRAIYSVEKKLGLL
jgi:hypothetical protein